MKWTERKDREKEWMVESINVIDIVHGVTWPGVGKVV